MRFVKGHGTENDFVILPDPDGALDLTAPLAAALCDRRAGIGADGVLRVVRTKVVDEPLGDAEWFMDYRNADGSLAEMCGNGARVFARYLVDAGLATPGEFDIATRGGTRRVSLEATGEVSVDMGPPVFQGPGQAVLAGDEYTGLRISMGNPHLACRIDGPVRDLDLTRGPDFDPEVFPEGVNLELFRRLGDHHVEMRVYERGSGETRACGTGAVATAVAAAIGAADPREAYALVGGSLPRGEWIVDVPGGRVTVTLEGQTSHLRGPAVLVATGDVRSDWLAAGT